MTWKSALTAAVMVAAAASASNAELLTNGGFETADFTGWTQFGDTSFTLVNNTYAHSGAYSAAFGPVYGAGGIEQTIVANANDTVRVSFWLATLGSPPNAMTVTLDGQVLSTLVDVPESNFTQYSFDVLVGNANPTLRFEMYHLPGYYILDDVSAMTIVPLPQGAAIGLAGLVGVAGVAHARRRRLQN